MTELQGSWASLMLTDAQVVNPRVHTMDRFYGERLVGVLDERVTPFRWRLMDAHTASVHAHGAHPNGKPLGVPANAETKRARIDAHNAFDQLWRGRAAKRTRVEAYAWLAAQLGLAPVDCHMGGMSAEQCRRVVEVCTAELSK